MSIVTSHERLVLDLSTEQKKSSPWAAGKRGRTLEESAITLLEAAAEDIIRGDHDATIYVSPRAYRQVLDALDNPPEPNEQLRAAFERYRKMVGE